MTADLNSPLYTTQTGKVSLTAKDFVSGNNFMSSPDVVKKLQSLSGVASGTELISGLYVHGGNNDENLFLLDGTPLYQVNHAGGLFSAFNTDIIKNIDFYKSGFPARYGGRLSSVVDVRTNDGNLKEYRGSFTLGLLEGRIQFEGPIVKNRTSFNVALRRTWMDLLTAPALAIINSSRRNKQNLRYAFHDLNAKVTHIFSEKAVRISAFIREMTFSSSGIKNTCLTRNLPMWTSSVCNGETSLHLPTGNTFSRTRCLPILQGFIPIIGRTSIT